MAYERHGRLGFSTERFAGQKDQAVDSPERGLNALGGPVMNRCRRCWFIAFFRMMYADFHQNTP